MRNEGQVDVILKLVHTRIFFNSITSNEGQFSFDHLEVLELNSTQVNFPLHVIVVCGKGMSAVAWKFEGISVNNKENDRASVRFFCEMIRQHAIQPLGETDVGHNSPDVPSHSF